MVGIGTTAESEQDAQPIDRHLLIAHARLWAAETCIRPDHLLHHDQLNRRRSDRLPLRKIGLSRAEQAR
jgi:hypothetical protein